MRGRYELTMLLDIAGLSKQIYYYHVKRGRTEDKDAKIKAVIMDIFARNYEKYGSPRITIALRKAGYHVNHKKGERLMQELGIQARVKARKYRSYKGDVGRIAPNILEQEFTTTRCYEKLGTDVTVFIGRFGKVYFSPIIDFHSREILAYNTSVSPDYRQIAGMLKALEKDHGGQIKAAIIQSDQGWQYQMEKYRLKLRELGLIQSMSRKGNCLDNSPTENLFGRMKEEMFYGKEDKYETSDDLIEEIDEYVYYYNHYRIVNKLKMSPLEFKEMDQIKRECYTGGS
jgi:putative transposase